MLKTPFYRPRVTTLSPPSRELTCWYPVAVAYHVSRDVVCQPCSYNASKFGRQSPEWLLTHVGRRVRVHATSAISDLDELNDEISYLKLQVDNCNANYASNEVVEVLGTILETGYSADAPGKILLAGAAVSNGRLPDILMATFPEHFPTPTSARKACRRRIIFVDGKRGKCDTEVFVGQLLTKIEPAEETTGPRAVIKLDVVYEDDVMAVILKPYGIRMHGLGKRTVKHALRSAVQQSQEGDAFDQAHAVHRLDAATGGLVVVAKAKSAAAALAASFEYRLVRKRYRALLAGRLEGEGLVSHPVRGKEATSRYAVVSHSRSLKFGGWITTVDMWPRTGRTHQLRQHMLSLGHPILGDRLYTPDGQDLLEGQGLFLWAMELDLPHPVSGTPLHFEAPEPARFIRLKEQQQRRWEKFNPPAISSGVYSEGK